MASQSLPQIVVVTGASSGLGKATALRFAADGWHVALLARGEAGLQATRAEIISADGQASVHVVDVCDADALAKVAADIETGIGPIATWVNVAGVGTYAYFAEQDAADFDHVIATNLLGSANGTRVALSHMLPRNHGHIVQIGSAIAHRGIPLQLAYASAKWGLRGMHQAIRAELIHRKSGVVLALVNPPGMNTPFFNHARINFPGKAAHVPPPAYAVTDTVDAIVRASKSKRVEWNVGSSSIGLFLADRFLPTDPLDWAIGRFGVGSQLTDDPKVLAQRDEAFEQPGKRVSDVDGPFSAIALRTSAIWGVTKRPWTSLAAASGVLLAGAWLAVRDRRSGQ